MKDLEIKMDGKLYVFEIPVSVTPEQIAEQVKILGGRPKRN